MLVKGEEGVIECENSVLRYYAKRQHKKSILTNNATATTKYAFLFLSSIQHVRRASGECLGIAILHSKTYMFNAFAVLFLMLTATYSL